MLASLMLMFATAVAAPSAPVDPQRPWPTVWIAPASPPDASFDAFAIQLRAALARHDAAFVRAIVPDDIKSTFGWPEGREAFEAHWRLDAPGSPFWETMRALLDHGFLMEDRQRFAFPGCEVEHPSPEPPDYDYWEQYAACAAPLALRATPAPDAPVLAMLEREAVRRTSRTPVDGFVEVERRDGTRGWMQEAALHSNTGWRGKFTRTAAGWKLTTLIAGD